MKRRLSYTLALTIGFFLLSIPVTYKVHHYARSMLKPVLNGLAGKEKAYPILHAIHWPAHVFGACGLLVENRLSSLVPLGHNHPLVLYVADAIGWGFLGMVVGTWVDFRRRPRPSNKLRRYARRFGLAVLYLACGALVVLAIPHLQATYWGWQLRSSDPMVRAAALEELSERAGRIWTCRYFELRPLAHDTRLAQWSFRRAAPALRRLALQGTKEERVEACSLLRQGHMELDETLSRLIEMLRDPSEDVREGTLECLGMLRGDADRAVPALLSALRTEKGALRCAVVKALRGVGQDDPSTVPPMVECLSDSDPGVRSEALAALECRRPIEASDVRRLLCAWDSDAVLVHDEAVSQLISSNRWQAIAASLELLREDPTPVVRARAAALLGRLDDHDAIPALEQATHDKSEEVRAAAARALAKLRSTSRGDAPSSGD